MDDDDTSLSGGILRCFHKRDGFRRNIIGIKRFSIVGAQIKWALKFLNGGYGEYRLRSLSLHILSIFFGYGNSRSNSYLD